MSEAVQMDQEVDRSKMTVSDEVAIQITDMNKWYGSFHVLRDINLTVYRGERIVVCGPSGSGKSTLIRCINKLEEHQAGDIIVGRQRERGVDRLAHDLGDLVGGDQRDTGVGDLDARGAERDRYFHVRCAKCQRVAVGFQLHAGEHRLGRA